MNFLQNFVIVQYITTTGQKSRRMRRIRYELRVTRCACSGRASKTDWTIAHRLEDCFAIIV